MSVVAGVSLVNAVIIASDCRVTVTPSHRGYDWAQKLFLVSPGLALGFVADDGHIAGALVRTALTEVQQRKHLNCYSLMIWLQRHFRYHYARLAHDPPVQGVGFMLAFSDRRRPACADRDRLMSFMQQCTKESGHGSTSQTFMQLVTAGSDRYVNIVGWPLCGILTMHSPGFELQMSGYQDYAVIGSGSSAADNLDRIVPHILVEHLEDGPFVQESLFRSAINNYLVASQDESVGGMVPMLRLEGDMTTYVGFSGEVPAKGQRFELAWDGASWHQRNLSTGKSIGLLKPWEITRARVRHDRFDDMRDAIRAQRTRGPFWSGEKALRFDEAGKVYRGAEPELDSIIRGAP